jgi:diphthamide synthase subunit DPH2
MEEANSMRVYARCISKFPFILPLEKEVMGKTVVVNEDIVPNAVYILDNEHPEVKKAFSEKRLFLISPVSNTAPIEEKEAVEVPKSKKRRSKKQNKLN